MRAFGFNDSRVDAVDADFFGPELASENAGDSVQRAFGGGVHGAARRSDAADAGAYINDAGTRAEVLDGGLGGEEDAEHVDIEHTVEGIFGDRFEGREFVDAGIIHQNIEAAVVFDGCGDDALSVGGFGNVTTNRDRLAACCRDGAYNFIRAGFAGSVVYNDCCAFGCERFGDGCADAFGGAGYYCDFTF